jgi:ubiquinone/menaquinone biosynthesis C-methylase UbiE
MNRQNHWNEVYRTKGAQNVSWFQTEPVLSLALIKSAQIPVDGGVLDVGGGASVLVDRLLDAGYAQLGVLDISAEALALARQRLGARAGSVEWFEADVTKFQPPHRFPLWHDRAVFHFLTAAADRRAYRATLERTLAPGGAVIIATFASNGPPQCSGLDVARYDEQTLSAELGTAFALREVRRETHRTPWNTEQRFVYCRFQHLSPA